VAALDAKTLLIILRRSKYQDKLKKILAINQIILVIVRNQNALKTIANVLMQEFLVVNIVIVKDVTIAQEKK